MKTEEFKTIILKADEGMYITQVADVPVSERIVANTLALGKLDTADNYKEITKEEGDAIKAEQENIANQ